MVTTIITAMAAYSNERVAAIILSVLYRMLTEISELAFHRKNLIDEEKKLMDSHMEKLRSLQESHLKEIHRHLKSESGFFLTGWVSKYSVIAFWGLYAYFCITIAIWIFCIN